MSKTTTKTFDISSILVVAWQGATVPDALLQEVLNLLGARPRIIIGLAGAPGAGKSTIAAALAQALEMQIPGQVALVPMDGFHLAQSEIQRQGLNASKGIPETFDGAGYVALLERLRDSTDTVHAPEFRREIDDPIAGAIPIPPTARVIITEGNYLLLNTAPWSSIRDLMDAAWFVSLPENDRLARLVTRHMQYKEDEASATSRALGPDQRNAELVEASRARADLIIEYQ